MLRELISGMQDIVAKGTASHNVCSIGRIFILAIKLRPAARTQRLKPPNLALCMRLTVL